MADEAHSIRGVRAIVNRELRQGAFKNVAEHPREPVTHGSGIGSGRPGRRRGEGGDHAEHPSATANLMSRRAVALRRRIPGGWASLCKLRGPGSIRDAVRDEGVAVPLRHASLGTAGTN
jgi:hypothetical protein